MSALWQLTAVEAVDLLKAGKVSPLDLIDAAADRIAAVEPSINALPTLCLDRARDRAKAWDRAGAGSGGAPGPLHGLPVAVKDLNAVAGVRTTWGSPIFRDHVPATSDFLVEVIEAHGANTIAKANTPEFGAGASTFNEVFGLTRNPWNTSRSVAGSSGGSAASLAAGEVWLATGSDLGGSLRTPSSFNGTVALRPTPGRVPNGPEPMPFDVLSVEGPMARTATDVALFLDAMASGHPRDPIRLAPPDRPFLHRVRDARPPRRVAWSPDLGGITPVDPEVRAICEQAVRRFEAMGAEVVEACPDLRDAMRAFQALRAVKFAVSMAPHYADPARRALLKPEVVWNIEKGLKATVEEVAWAEGARGRIVAEMDAFLGTHDLLVTPAAIVPPYPAEWRTVEEVNGTRFASYIDWIQITFALTLTACPVAACPAGLTADGMPVGLQIVARSRHDAKALGAAHLLDQATGLSKLLPVTPKG